MRKIAFVIMIVGMFLMFVLLNSSYEEIIDIRDLDNLITNKRVEISGKVVEEKNSYGENFILVLDNGFELICECSRIYRGKEIRVLGKVESYKDKKRIRVLKIFLDEL
ncbi:hypothetical protein HYV50_00925 [Candidatus Pacearchaeota archaeon]|nr:hypothetical protein [Candidatus Pacearchaeota archaeon]